MYIPFDPNSYLKDCFFEHFKFDYKTRAECLKYFAEILNGFTIKPDSITYNDETGLLIVDTSLPHSELNVEKLTISTRDLFKGINMILTVKEVTINIHYNAFNKEIEYSVLVNDENNKYSGIYYYLPWYNAEKNCVSGLYLKYNYDIISQIKVIKDSKRIPLCEDKKRLEKLIGYNPMKINSRWTNYDAFVWQDEKDYHPETLAKEINTQLQTLTYDDIMNKLAEFKNKCSSDKPTILIKK